MSNFINNIQLIRKCDTRIYNDLKENKLLVKIIKLLILYN